MDIPRNFHIMLCVMFSISVYNDGHKRRQTSRHVIEVEIQTNCNCKAHPFIASCLMITFASYSKIFRALRLHYTQIQDHAQQHPSHPNVLNIARYRKAVYNTLWVQLALFVCYLPYCILVILITFSKMSPTHLAVSAALTEVFISLNSNLNPFIYCWKMPLLHYTMRFVKHLERIKNRLIKGELKPKIELISFNSQSDEIIDFRRYLC